MENAAFLCCSRWSDFLHCLFRVVEFAHKDARPFFSSCHKADIFLVFDFYMFDQYCKIPKGYVARQQFLNVGVDI